MNNFSFYKDGRALYCLIFLGFILSFSSLQAKDPRRNLSSILQQQIQGTVTDGSNPLPGVTISIKNKSHVAAISDYNGHYSISASPGDTLVVSFIGFKKAFYPIQSRTRMDIVLEYDTTTLQEVHVNAGYYSVKESERTGSIARITSKDIENQPVSNVLAAMQGRMAGVNITQTTGVAGGGFDIQIRGRNSIRTDGNAPLYIIDGVPYSSETIGNNRSTVVLPATSDPLNSINPSDIESIEVLKDADATAIYGSRGANGVVLITTKKGKEGVTRFVLDYRQGIGMVTRFMDLMHTEQYLQMRTEAFKNDGIPFGPSDYDVNGTWAQNRYTDWQKEFIGGMASYTDLQGTLSGGSAQTQFLSSSSLHRETTVFPGDFGYNKANFRIAVNHESENGKFKINTTAGYTVQKNSQPSIDLTRYVTVLAPNAPSLYDESGNLNWENSTWENPLAALEGKYRTNTNDLTASTMLSYAIIPQLTIKTSLGFTSTNHYETRTQPSTMFDPVYQLGSEYSAITANSTERQSWIIEPQLEWSETYGKLKTQVLFGSTFQKLTGGQLLQEATGYTSNALIYNLASAKVLNAVSDTESIYKYQAFFGRLNFVFDDKYIINLTGRRDGSSRFGPGNQFANFGAVGAAWIFIREKNNNLSIINYGKIRASYGTTGSDQIGDYQFINTYTSTGVKYGGVIGILPTRLFNPNFKWEINNKLEAALETGFFEDRIFLTAAWYLNRSSSQLVGIPLAATTGFASIQSNLNATVQNTGLEITLRTVNFQKKHFSWTTNFNISIAKNKLLSFPQLKGSTYENKFIIGEPLNIVKTYHYKAVDPSSGNYQFEDVNNDGKITSPEDKIFVSDLNPKFFGGLQNQITWKNWRLDFLFQFSKQKNYSEEYTLGMPGTMNNQTTRITNRWQKIGDASELQKYSTGADGKTLDAASKYFSSDAVITDASYVRLKNVSLSFALPKEWIKKVQCRISFEGQNLLTFTPYKGMDPEFKFTGYLPPLTVFTTGLNLTF
ncbi:SusC/RagA family TonB-linked outer membrane protein [Flavobacterium johnsoniae]|uniref:SusC/RagA family TonB-linked outer membrane protein n=1 Tax=Flavobacterium johnsoniae TaxID=986 RepID=UPI0025B0A959|nr:SusC/RagA family TonB-linked outer membrane protein [Flavobacterium johnsoniae]WJS93382.1 SusC/RagA family TonB-linked outer membrane protein [Flavobacterium johnsoniae]